MENSNNPAYPLHPEKNPTFNETCGLTKREFIATQLTASLLVSCVSQKETFLSKIRRLFGSKNWMVENHYNEQKVVASGISVADELLKQLEQ